MSSPCRRTLETTLCRKKPFCLTSLSVNTQAIGVRPVEPMKVEAPVFISLPHTGHCMVHSPCCDSLRRPKPSGRSILSQRRRIFQRGEKNSGSGRLSAGKAPGENQKVFVPWDKDLFSVITQHYRFFEICFKKTSYDSKKNLMHRTHLSFDSSVVSETAPSSRSVTT